MNSLLRAINSLFWWALGLVSGAAVKATGSWWDVAWVLVFGLMFWLLGDWAVRRGRTHA